MPGAGRTYPNNLSSSISLSLNGCYLSDQLLPLLLDANTVSPMHPDRQSNVGDTPYTMHWALGFDIRTFPYTPSNNSPLHATRSHVVLLLGDRPS